VELLSANSFVLNGFAENFENRKILNLALDPIASIDSERAD
jgi:hypothetical protein